MPRRGVVGDRVPVMGGGWEGKVPALGRGEEGVVGGLIHKRSWHWALVRRGSWQGCAAGTLSVPLGGGAIAEGRQKRKGWKRETRGKEGKVRKAGEG